jgi:glycosyltransferase involved in cell wall biosynthesis
MKLVITIPAYNEEVTIAGVIAGIPRRMDGVASVAILVLDDGSTDGTVAAAQKAGADKVIRHRENKGLGTAFKRALDEALAMGADIIVNIDADGQYNALDIPRLIAPIIENRADIVLGWRDIGKLDFMPAGKKIGNRLATRATRMLSGFPVKDAQTGFRAFSRDAALRMYLSGSYTYVQETLMQARYKGLIIEQVPVDFRERKGKSRLISSIFSYAARAGRIIFITFKDYRPLRLFLYSGFVLFLIGFGLGIRVLVHFIQTGGVTPHMPSAIAATLLIIVGMGTMLFGIIADMFKKQRLLSEEILYRLKKSEGKKTERKDSFNKS